jgi:hypothetical protein
VDCHDAYVIRDAIIIKRSLPHAAVLGTLRRIGLDRLLGPVGNTANRCRDLVIAMIVARLIAPLSKLATDQSPRSDHRRLQSGRGARFGAGRRG